MTTLSFEGKEYSASRLEADLILAAHGTPNTIDPYHMYDGKEWASAIITAAKETPFAQEAAAVCGRLLGSTDEQVRALAIELQFSFQIASSADTLQAMGQRRQAGDLEAVAILAAAISKQIFQGAAAYLPALRDYRDIADARDSLMRVYLRCDLDWVVASLASLLPADSGAAVTAIACGLSGMDKAEISDIRRALTPALPSLPAAVAAAVAAYLEKRSA